MSDTHARWKTLIAIQGISAGVLLHESHSPGVFLRVGGRWLVALGEGHRLTPQEQTRSENVWAVFRVPCAVFPCSLGLKREHGPCSGLPCLAQLAHSHFTRSDQAA